MQVLFGSFLGAFGSFLGVLGPFGVLWGCFWVLLGCFWVLFWGMIFFIEIKPGYYTMEINLNLGAEVLIIIHFLFITRVIEILR